jgi:hypothetical protein
MTGGTTTTTAGLVRATERRQVRGGMRNLKDDPSHLGIRVPHKQVDSPKTRCSLRQDQTAPDFRELMVSPYLRLIRRATSPWRSIETGTALSLTVHPSSNR